MNKKVAFLVSLGFLVLLSYPAGSVLAQLRGYGPDINLYGFIDSIISMSWIIFGGIAVVCFVISGILFLTAAGDPTKLHTARTSLYWGVAGVIVGIVAYSIISIVSSMITGYGGGGGYYNNGGYNDGGYYGGGGGDDGWNWQIWGGGNW